MRIALLIAALVIYSSPAKSEIHPLSAEAANYFQQKNYDSALVLYKEITRLFPEKQEGYLNQGLCFYYLGKYQQAISLFDTSLVLHSTPDALWMKALALEKAGNLEGALETFEKLDNSFPGHYNISRRTISIQFALFISRNWYYMIALLLIVVVFVVLTGRIIAHKEY